MEVSVFAARSFEVARIQHSHGNNDWHDMNDVTPSHDTAESDPERGWFRGRIFRCSTCDDEIRVDMPDESDSTNRP